MGPRWWYRRLLNLPSPKKTLNIHLRIEHFPDRQLMADWPASVQQTRDEMHKEGWETAEALQDMCQWTPFFTFSLHLDSTGKSSIQELWLTCKVSRAHSWPHCPQPTLALTVRAQVAIHAHAQGHRTWSQLQSQIASTPGATCAHLGYNWPGKTTQHTQRTQRSLLHKVTFSRMRDSYFI